MVWSADMAHVALLGKHGESEMVFGIVKIILSFSIICHWAFTKGRKHKTWWKKYLDSVWVIFVSVVPV